MANSIDNWIQNIRHNHNQGRVRIFDRSNGRNEERMTKNKYYRERRDKLLKKCPWVRELKLYKEGKKPCFYVTRTVLEYVKQEKEDRRQIFEILKADFLVEGYKFLAEMED